MISRRKRWRTPRRSEGSQGKERSNVKVHRDKIILMKFRSRLKEKLNTLVPSRRRLNLFVSSY